MLSKKQIADQILQGFLSNSCRYNYMKALSSTRSNHQLTAKNVNKANVMAAQFFARAQGLEPYIVI